MACDLHERCDGSCHDERAFFPPLIVGSHFTQMKWDPLPYDIDARKKQADGSSSDGNEDAIRREPLSLDGITPSVQVLGFEGREDN